jgi:hypothetical protein
VRCHRERDPADQRIGRERVTNRGTHGRVAEVHGVGHLLDSRNTAGHVECALTLFLRLYFACEPDVTATHRDVEAERRGDPVGRQSNVNFDLDGWIGVAARGAEGAAYEEGTAYAQAPDGHRCMAL